MDQENPSFTISNALSLALLTVVSMFGYIGKKYINKVDVLESAKADKAEVLAAQQADKADIDARFDEVAENQRELVKKIDGNQQETTRLLLQLVKHNGG